MSDPKALWRSQKTEETVTLANIHDRAEKFQRRVSWGNAAEYVAAAFVVAVFGWYVWLFPSWMMKAGSALNMVAVCYAVWQLRRRGKSRTLPAASGLRLIDFHRSELERRRDVLKTAWSWYILPIVPGSALLLAGRWFQFHAPWRSLAWDHEIIILASMIAVLVLVLVRLVHVYIAGKLQRQIDELDRLRAE